MLLTTLINSANALYTDKDFSWLQDLVLTGGYFATQAGARTFKVVQKGTPAMGVDIQVGKILIPFTKSGISWKVIVETTGEALTVASNATGAVRADAVIVKLDTTVVPNAGKSNVAVAQILTGSSATPLSDGAIQTAIGATYNFIRLADIMVPNGAVTIVDGNINNVIAKVKLTQAIDVDASALNYSGGLLSTYVTQDNTTISGADQTQLTVNGTIEFGEANLTTKKNIIEQSFTAQKTKNRGFTLWKKPDTGTFTGTVTLALQADSSGSPSGTDLATATFTNAQWINTPSDALFTGLFSTEYASQVVGNLYWIIARTSTSDNSNHPNLGTNTAGGYASGSLKYKNTPDGHVAVATIDLYFQTLEGNISQVVKTNTSGKIPNDLLDTTGSAFKPVFQQSIKMYQSASGYSVTPRYVSTTQDGNVMVVAVDGAVNSILRYAKDPNTGTWVFTHIQSTLTGGGGGFAGWNYAHMTILGNYVYVIYDNNTTVWAFRLNLADLTTPTALTIPSIDTSGSNWAMRLYNDGLNLYLYNTKTNLIYKLSVSGTTLTLVSSVTPDGTFQPSYSGEFFDGISVYLAYNNTTSGFTLYKVSNLLTGASTSANVYLPSANGTTPFIANIDNSRNIMYAGCGETIYNATTNDGSIISFFPITKPI